MTDPLPLTERQIVPFLRSCIRSGERLTFADTDAIEAALDAARAERDEYASQQVRMALAARAVPPAPPELAAILAEQFAPGVEPGPMGDWERYAVRLAAAGVTVAAPPAPPSDADCGWTCPFTVEAHTSQPEMVGHDWEPPAPPLPPAPDARDALREAAQAVVAWMDDPTPRAKPVVFGMLVGAINALRAALRDTAAPPPLDACTLCPQPSHTTEWHREHYGNFRQRPVASDSGDRGAAE